MTSRYSYISLDRTAGPLAVLVGEYQSGCDAAPIRTVQHELDGNTNRLSTDSSGEAKGS